MTEKHGIFKLFFIRHFRACVASLDQLIRKPISSLFTIAVIGIALMLPAAFEVLLQNVRLLGDGFDRGVQISIYLRNDISNAQIQAMIKQLRENKHLAVVDYISPDKGLDEFQRSSGFANVLSGIGENPLPPVIIVKPHLSLQSSASITSFINSIKLQPEIENVRLDYEWVKRLYYFFELGQRLMIALYVVFGVAVALIISNTMRLKLRSSRKEMMLLKLCGASNAFVRRSYLYTGLFYGLFGGLIAWSLVNVFVRFLSEPVSKLALSYGSSFYLHNLQLEHGALLLGAGMLFGLIGAWQSVTPRLWKM